MVQADIRSIRTTGFSPLEFHGRNGIISAPQLHGDKAALFSDEERTRIHVLWNYHPNADKQ